MKMICDNTNCKNKDIHFFYQVQMKEEFEGEKAIWCKECIERDEDFIKKKKLIINKRKKKESDEE